MCGGGGGYEKSLWVHVKEYEKSLCVCVWVGAGALGVGMKGHCGCRCTGGMWYERSLWVHMHWGGGCMKGHCGCTCAEGRLWFIRRFCGVERFFMLVFLRTVPLT